MVVRQAPLVVRRRNVDTGATLPRGRRLKSVAASDGGGSARGRGRSAIFVLHMLDQLRTPDVPRSELSACPILRGRYSGAAHARRYTSLDTTPRANRRCRDQRHRIMLG